MCFLVAILHQSSLITFFLDFIYLSGWHLYLAWDLQVSHVCHMLEPFLFCEVSIRHENYSKRWLLLRKKRHQSWAQSLQIIIPKFPWQSRFGIFKVKACLFIYLFNFKRILHQCDYFYFYFRLKVELLRNRVGSTRLFKILISFFVLF